MAKLRNSGKEFEKLVHEIYVVLAGNTPGAKVTLDEKIDGPDGSRQVDVSIRHSVAGIEYLTAIECRDHARKLTVTDIDAFASKLTDIRASKGIIVSSNGFSRSATQKASRLGIDLMVGGKAPSLKNHDIQSIPFVFCRIKIPKLAFALRVGDSLHNEFQLSHDLKINGKGFDEIIGAAHARGLISEAESAREKMQSILGQFTPDFDDFNAVISLGDFFNGKPVSLENPQGQRLNASQAAMLLSLERIWSFGHISDVEKALQLSSVQTDRHNFLIKVEDVPHLDAKFVPIRSLNEIPEYAKQLHIVVTVVESIGKIVNVTAQKYDV